MKKLTDQEKINYIKVALNKNHKPKSKSWWKKYTPEKHKDFIAQRLYSRLYKAETEEEKNTIKILLYEHFSSL